MSDSRAGRADHFVTIAEDITEEVRTEATRDLLMREGLVWGTFPSRPHRRGRHARRLWLRAK